MEEILLRIILVLYFIFLPEIIINILKGFYDKK